MFFVDVVLDRKIIIVKIRREFEYLGFIRCVIELIFELVVWKNGIRIGVDYRSKGICDFWFKFDMN